MKRFGRRIGRGVRRIGRRIGRFISRPFRKLRNFLRKIRSGIKRLRSGMAKVRYYWRMFRSVRGFVRRYPGAPNRMLHLEPHEGLANMSEAENADEAEL